MSCTICQQKISIARNSARILSVDPVLVFQFSNDGIRLMTEENSPCYSNINQLEAAIALNKQEADLVFKYDTVRSNTLKLVALATGAIVALAITRGNPDINFILFGALALIAISSALFAYSCTVARKYHHTNSRHLRKHLMQRALPESRLKRIEEEQVDSLFLDYGSYSMMLIFLPAAIPSFGAAVCLYLAILK
jgi:hypothetical protein